MKATIEVAGSYLAGGLLLIKWRGNKSVYFKRIAQIIKGAAVNMYTFTFYVAMKKYTRLRRHPLCKNLNFIQELKSGHRYT